MKLPPPLSWFWEGWMMLSLAIGFVMSRIILTILWIVGFGIYGIIAKILKLSKQTPAADSYWIAVPPDDADTFERQF